MFGWCGRMIAKGYLTSGQAEYILIFAISVLITAGQIVVTSVMRFARAEALRHSLPNAEPETVRALMWSIAGKLLNLNLNTEGDHDDSENFSQ
jgi:hypothetical protein